MPRLELGRQPPNPDVEIAARLRHVPRVSRQTFAEKPQAAGLVAPVVGELLLQHGRLEALGADVRLAEEVAVDRAARAAGAHEPAATVGAVDDVPAVPLLDL